MSKRLAQAAEVMFYEPFSRSRIEFPMIRRWISVITAPIVQGLIQPFPSVSHHHGVWRLMEALLRPSINFCCPSKGGWENNSPLADTGTVRQEGQTLWKSLPFLV